MKKITTIAMLAAMAVATTAFAGRGPSRHGGRRGAPPRHAIIVRTVPSGGHHYRHHNRHHSFWGRGGRNFWPGFVGGVVGGVVYDTVTTPTIVTTPTVVAAPTTVVTVPAATTVVSTPATTVQNVWVEGRYVDQIQPNGTTIRVWQPAHYEQRQVYVP